MSRIIARRFVAKGVVINVALVSGVIAFAAIGAASVFRDTPDATAIAAYLGSAGVLVVVAAVLGSLSWRHAAVLRRLQVAHPEGTIFLARRIPTVVSDVENFMASKGFGGALSEGWVPAVVDHRGISVWTTGRAPTQVLLMEWAELGEIAVVPRDVNPTDPRPLVAVDVRPYIVPLTAELGATLGFITMRLDRVDTETLVAVTNAHRPAATTLA